MAIHLLWPCVIFLVPSYFSVFSAFRTGMHSFSTEFHYLTSPAPSVKSGGPREQGRSEFWFSWNHCSCHCPFHTRENFPLAWETQLSSYQSNILIQQFFDTYFEGESNPGVCEKHQVAAFLLNTQPVNWGFCWGRLPLGNEVQLWTGTSGWLRATQPSQAFLSLVFQYCVLNSSS